jgi:hypothetical protein
MKRNILPYALLLSCSMAVAQIQPPSLPSPLLSEVEMKTWPADPLAEAVVLSDNGETRFFHKDNGLDLQFTRTTKIKIISEPGVEFANIEVPLYISDNATREEIRYVQGKVHNIENGGLKTTTFDTKLMYEERINNKWVKTKFALPNVKPGSLIEYTYTVTSPFKFNLPDWQFQWEIPVVSSRYLLTVVPFYEYIFLFQGAMKFSKQKTWDGTETQKLGPASYKERYYEFVMENVPAFRDEEYITSVEDNILKIDFQLAKFTDAYGVSQNVISTWKALSQELMKEPLFGKYIAASERQFKGNLPFVLSTDTLATVKSAIEYVKNQFEWDQSYRLFTVKKVGDFMNQKKGNSAEKNLLAIGLLAAAGIEATPVLISTRNHGRIASDYPFVNAFNHTLIYVNINKTPYLLDATDPYCPFGLLPLQCINNKGYMVDKKNSDNWVTLSGAKQSQIAYSLELTPNPNTEVTTAQITASASNYDAIKWRKAHINDVDDFKKTRFNNLQIDTFETQNLEDVDKRLIVKAIGETELEQAAGNIIINPFSGLCETKNIFKSEKREYAVDLTYAYRRDYISTIVIPDGYEVKSLPATCTINTPQMQFTRQETRTDNKLTISASYVFTKAIYPPEEYTQLKNSFAQMVSRLNASLILAPIDNSNVTAESK